MPYCTIQWVSGVPEQMRSTLLWEQHFHPRVQEIDLFVPHGQVTPVPPTPLLLWNHTTESGAVFFIFLDSFAGCSGVGPVSE